MDNKAAAFAKEWDQKIDEHPGLDGDLFPPQNTGPSLDEFCVFLEQCCETDS